MEAKVLGVIRIMSLSREHEERMARDKSKDDIYLSKLWHMKLSHLSYNLIELSSRKDNYQRMLLPKVC